MSWKIEFFETPSGRAPVLEWIEGMDEEDMASALGYIDQLSELGTEARMPLAKPLGNKLYELRWPFGDKQHRIIYFAAPGQKFVMLNGFVKKRRETPPKEMQTALRRKREYNQRAKG
jgi:phage-related protein